MTVRAATLLLLLPALGIAAVLSVTAATRRAPEPGLRGAVMTAIAARQIVPRSPPGCERCHGELELLRQQVATLARARELLVYDSVVATSAHGDMSCASCHSHFASFPHERRAATAACESCHEAADTLWSHGAHGQTDEPVACASCHTIHAVASAETLSAPEGAALANAPCITCHATDVIATHDPHASAVSCAACHAPHDTRAVDDTASWLAPARQLHTCGTCHDSTATVWHRDIHGDTALQRQHQSARAADGPVLCTSCHAGHRMRAAADSAHAVESVTRCALCHEHAARTFFGSYHGKATALGSRVTATCADCHGAHEILPDTFAASRVAQASLVDTCRDCHEHARPRFVQYDSHPDPFDRGRNPWIFYSFWLMNGLLIFVVIVFGAHTLLWWLRLWLDRRRGVGHGGAA